MESRCRLQLREWVTNFNYLGSLFTEYVKYDEEVKRRTKVRQDVFYNI